MKKQPVTKRIVSWILVLAMLLSLIPGNLVPAAFAAGSGVDITGAQTLMLNQGAPTDITTSGVYTVSGISNQPIRIGADSGTKVDVTLVLSGLTITADTSPIQILGGSKLTLVLADGTQNTLTCTKTGAAGVTAGILCKFGATLVVDKAQSGKGTGVLNVTGGYGGAGIGGSAASGLTNIRNQNGVDAYLWAWPQSRAIGGMGGRNGNDATAAGKVVINAGTVNATGGYGGAGIGGGMGAAGENGAQGQPCGEYNYLGQNWHSHTGGSGGDVTINGGTVFAKATPYTVNGVGDMTAAGIGGGAGGLGGSGAAGTIGHYSGNERGGGNGGYGQAGYVNYRGDGGQLTINGGKLTASGNAGFGSTQKDVKVDGRYPAYNTGFDLRANGAKGTSDCHGGRAGEGGRAIKPEAPTSHASIKINDSNSNVRFLDSTGNNTVLSNQPTDKNNSTLYQVTLNVLNKADNKPVSSANVEVAVNKTDAQTKYVYKTVSDINGKATLWLPKDEYPLSFFDVKRDDVGIIQQGDGIILNVAENNNNQADVKIGLDVAANASVANTSKVYINDKTTQKDAPLSINIDTNAVSGSKLKDITWFREPVNGNGNKNYALYQTKDDPAFDRGYKDLVDANKTENYGTITVANGKEAEMPILENGRYWFKIPVTVPDANDSSKTMTVNLVRLVEVKNIYREYPIQVRHEYLKKDGQVDPKRTKDYQALTYGNEAPYTESYGFAWDLNGYNATDITKGTLLEGATPDKVYIHALSTQKTASWYTAALGATEIERKDNHTGFKDPVELTLDKNFLTNSNTYADMVGGKKDFSKYTIRYTPEGLPVAEVDIKGVVPNADGTETEKWGYTQTYPEGTTAADITGNTIDNYRIAKVLVNGVDRTADLKDGTIALKDLQGTQANNYDDAITEVKFVYADNTADVTINAYLKGTTTQIDGFNQITVRAEIGKPFKYDQPVVTGYDYEGVTPDEGTLEKVSADGNKNVINFYYLKSNGNVTYQAVDAADKTIISTKSIKVDKGATIDKSTNKAKAVFGDIPYYTLQGEGKADPEVDSYNGKDDVTVTYTYTRNTHTLTVLKKDIDSDKDVDKAYTKKVPAGKLYTFGATEITEVADYTPVSKLNPSSHLMGDKDETITYWYRKDDKNRYATITVESTCDTNGDGKAEVFNSYQIPAFKDVELKVSAPSHTGYVLKNTDPAATSQSIKPNGDAKHDKVTFEYVLDNPRNVNVTLINKADGSTLTAPTGYRSAYVLKKGDNITVQAPVMTGYTLRGAALNGTDMQNMQAINIDDSLTAPDNQITFYYLPIQSGMTLKCLYNGYELAADEAMDVTCGEVNKIKVPAFKGYEAATYQFVDGNAQPVNGNVNGTTIAITPQSLTGTLTINYTRPDNTIVLPGQDGKIPAPADKDNIIVKPGENGSLEGPKDPNGSVEVKNDNATVTRPNPTNKDEKEEIIVPGGTTIDKDGNITLPEPKPNGTVITPDTKIPQGLPADSNYIAITYHANNKTGESKKEIGVKNQLQVKDNTFKAIGNASFEEWNTRSDGNGDKYSVNDKPDKSVNLYAQWSDNYKQTATIIYKPNGGTPDKEATQKVGNDADKNLIAKIESNKFEVNGWKFGGWNEQANGTGTLYLPGAKHEMNNGDKLTLYAQWYKQTGNTITVPGKDGNPNNEQTNVTGQGNGISCDDKTGIIIIPAGGSITITKPNGEQETVGLPNGGTLKPDGSYIITQPDGGKIEVDPDGTETPKDDKGDVKPNAKIVIMTYHSNNGENGVFTVKAIEGQDTTIGTNPFTYKGYTFLNWMGTDKKEYTPGQEIKAAQGEYYAQWYKQNADGNGAIELPGKDGAIAAPADKDNIIVKPGENGSLEGPKDPNGSVEVKNDNATVTRPDPTDPNYPNGSKEEIKVPEGTIISPDGTIKLPDGTTIKPEDKFPDDVISKNYVIATYEANGGTGNTIRQMVKKNEETPLEDSAQFTAPRGKTFDSWYDENNKKTYKTTDKLTISKDITLKAQWKNSAPAPIAYSATIELDPNTGDQTATQKLTDTKNSTLTGKLDTYSTHFTAPAEWTFMGWSTAKAAGQYTSFYKDGAEVTLRDQATLKLYAILYKHEDNGNISLPGKDGQPETGDEITITPAPGTTLTPGQGYVEAPAGSTITLPNGNTLTVTEGTVKVYPDGSIYVPDDSKVQLPDNTEIGGGNGDGNGGTTIKPDGTVNADKNKPTQKPDGSIILPGTDGNIGTDDDITVKPNNGKPSGRIDEDGNVTITNPGGADITIPDRDPSELQVPNGTIITPDGTITLVYTIEYKDTKGKTIRKADTITLQEGQETVVKAKTINGYKLRSDQTYPITAAVSDTMRDYTIIFYYVAADSSTGGGSTGGGGGGSTVTSYIIKASAGNGGIITPTGNVSVNRGQNKTFTITAINGYRIADVLVDGKSVGNVSTYTFKNVKDKHTIEAKFEKRTSIIADPTETGVAGWLQTSEHIAYLGGYGNGIFGPTDNMSRAQVAQMFYNLLLDKNVTITENFSDVPENAWYANAVNTLASIGVIKGVGSNQFDPNRTITRAEFAVIAMRFANQTATVTNPFTDVTENAWYYEAVTSAVSYGWIAGYSDGTFRPNATITRAEAASIVNRMLNRTADRDYVDNHNVISFTDVPKTYWAYYAIAEATNGHTHTIDNNGVETWGKLK